MEELYELLVRLTRAAHYSLILYQELTNKVVAMLRMSVVCFSNNFIFGYYFIQ